MPAEILSARIAAHRVQGHSYTLSGCERVGRNLIEAQCAS